MEFKYIKIINILAKITKIRKWKNLKTKTKKIAPQKNKKCKNNPTTTSEGNFASKEKILFNF